MPVYEIVRERLSRRPSISFIDREITEIGDVMTINGCRWIVVEKQPQFEERRIERLVCRLLPRSA